MTTQRVTIELPEAIFHRFVQIAEATQQPLEDLIAQSVVSNLPPSAENAPLEMRAELMEMQTFNVDELLAIAQTQADAVQHEHHVKLLEKNQAGLMSPEEQNELTNLRLKADRLMLRKAYAWSILRWKGCKVPPLKELAVPL
jgi:predicted transcriptional regulator